MDIQQGTWLVSMVMNTRARFIIACGWHICELLRACHILIYFTHHFCTHRRILSVGVGIYNMTTA